MWEYIRIEEIVCEVHWKCDLFYFDLVKVPDETDLSLSGTFNNWDKFNALYIAKFLQFKPESDIRVWEGILIRRYEGLIKVYIN